MTSGNPKHASEIPLRTDLTAAGLADSCTFCAERLIRYPFYRAFGMSPRTRVCGDCLEQYEKLRCAAVNSPSP